MPPLPPTGFVAEVFVGHKDTHAVAVPFDPTVQWPDLARVAMSRVDDPRGGTGWPVTVNVGSMSFAGFVGRRYERTYLILPESVRRTAGIVAGAKVAIEVVPRPV